MLGFPLPWPSAHWFIMRARSIFLRGNQSDDAHGKPSKRIGPFVSFT